jgi:hypothetical protein
MKNRFLVIACFALAIVAIPMMSSDAYGQKGTKLKKGDVVATKAVRSPAGQKAADPNVKTTRGNNNTQRGSTRGSSTRWCGIYWDNYTDLYVDVFVDGEYEGTVAPMGELQTYAIAGATRVYARADYDDGSYDYWGPNTFTCNAGRNYTRRLMD